MRLRACFALLLFLSACTTTPPSPREPAARDPRLANLQRAAKLPWTDGGRCAVREASEPWPELAERCFHALDHDRIEFHDTTGRCAVASAGAAVGVGLCVLAAPEIIVGAVIVAGVVVVGFAIKEALDAHELKWADQEDARPLPEKRPVPETAPAPQKPSPEKRPKPEPKGPDFPPLEPPEVTERDRHRCEPVPVPYHRGGNKLHDKCADRIPNNSFPGGDVFVNGKNFDALQLATRTLWEVKTDNFDTYPPELRRIVIEEQLPKLQYERALALACGFDFKVGVRSAAHKAALEFADETLEIVVMNWC
ncbi:hypothetical protein MEBOL_004800 [Melittangium boletus DSM 14713]|uniref:DUF6310 domain-containing protein n=1 Tax=Melittangium boletus DSM 14713 TaxID=1294270 RepID=A0A250IJA6_9BACT|nr:DUF6310 domain-containing protein [Melittangium boletus]ATB31338.1 hypothetical protein MEBOL_004800 [Melittangium boletus DSM 14713]